MSSTGRAIVAASVGVVEAMKDQGICRWNFIIRSAQQHAKNNLRSSSQTRNLSSSTSAMVSSKLRDEKMKQSEESLRKVILRLFDSNCARANISVVKSGKMSSTRKAVVAVSVGVVEAMKDQGICRWNFIIRSAQQHAKNNLRSISQTRNLSSSTSAMVSSKLRDEKIKQSEESLRKVMYLSCWGPN
ncbi:hypothetical protein CFP56_016740 [Quercus suber]|uniref:Wound-responsive family protein n=2 Tax=Quercus suber TaxID=58331 RepID=A0AAW0KNW3_QUESU